MRVSRRHNLLVLGLVVLAFAGCGESTDLASESSVVATAPGVEDQVAPAEGATEPSEKAESTLKTAARKARYRPPFPQRKELFTPPANSRRVTQRNGSGFEETVELKGIVKIDKPHAVLAINGVEIPIPVGEERKGVQVISIDEKTVVLHRGRDRWTAKLD